MVASTVSMTALVSVISLMIWLYGLIRASNTHRCQIRAGSGQTSLRVPPMRGVQQSLMSSCGVSVSA
jgi:hypothetical protein